MNLEFGELEKVATDNGFIWYAQLELKREIFDQVLFALLAQIGRMRIMRLFSSPQCTFYTLDKKWLMRFAEGALNICEPFSIGVIF